MVNLWDYTARCTDVNIQAADFPIPIPILSRQVQFLPDFIFAKIRSDWSSFSALLINSLSNLKFSKIFDRRNFAMEFLLSEILNILWSFKNWTRVIIEFHGDIEESGEKDMYRNIYEKKINLALGPEMVICPKTRKIFNF